MIDSFLRNWGKSFFFHFSFFGVASKSLLRICILSIEIANLVFRYALKFWNEMKEENIFTFMLSLGTMHEQIRKRSVPPDRMHAIRWSKNMGSKVNSKCTKIELSDMRWLANGKNKTVASCAQLFRFVLFSRRRTLLLSHSLARSLARSFETNNIFINYTDHTGQHWKKKNGYNI